jgi:hypothetical protein
MRSATAQQIKKTSQYQARRGPEISHERKSVAKRNKNNNKKGGNGKKWGKSVGLVAGM